MKALGHTRFGGEEVIEWLDMPVPEVTGHDLRVKIHAVGINPVDVKVRTNWGGFGDLQQSDPVISGWDAAGVVDAVGPNADGRFQPGDEVFFAGSVARQGHHREYSIVDSRVVGRKPASLSFTEAAALPLTSLTVWEGLIDNAGFSLDATGAPKKVLLVGGAGGVGSIAIQIMKKVLGFEVIATASRAVSVQHCRKLGADHIINHHEPLAPQFEQLGISAVDIVFHTSEPEANIEEIMPLVAPFGKIICILPISGTVDTSSLFARSISLVYELMFTKGLFHTGLSRQGQILDKISALVDAGTIHTTLVDVFPWTVEGLRAAHRRIEDRNGLGKAVLEVV